MISIGSLAGISYDDMLLGVSYCRNKKLAEVFYRLQLIESYGTGMGKILSSYQECPEKPLIQVSSGAFKIILPNRNTAEREKSEKPIWVSTREKEQALLDLFEKKQELTRAEAQKALGISLSTARRLLENLADDGHIKAVGKGKNVIFVLQKP